MTATPPTADPEAELEMFTQQKFFENILAGGAKSVERARTSGQLVQAAAAAIGTLYSGVLAEPSPPTQSRCRGAAYCRRSSLAWPWCSVPSTLPF